MIPTIGRASTRNALIYPDGSMTVLSLKGTREEAEAIAIKDDTNERDPNKMTTVAAVLITVMENYGKPSLRGDGGSPALNGPTLSTAQRALKIAADALEKISLDSTVGDHHRNWATDELARVRTLVPEIDA